MKDTVILPMPDDWHVHVRQGEALGQYTADCAQSAARALIMPNTIPPIRCASDLLNYRQEILNAAVKAGYADFVPLMTFKLFANQTESDIQELKAAGAIAGKLYPHGATTNAEDGTDDIHTLWPVFSAMEKNKLVLCIHGEDPQAYSLEREHAFLPRVAEILSAFPTLRIVLEHVSSKAGLDFVLSGPDRLGATITAHHLLSNLDDMLGGNLRPHLFCKPILKSPEDQKALQAAVLTAPSRIFYGSDSAPHTQVKKECDCGAAGVYSMPVAIPLLFAFFEKNQARDAFIRFTSTNGANFYGLPSSNKKMCLKNESWLVPDLIQGVVPYMAGSRLEWRIHKC